MKTKKILNSILALSLGLVGIGSIVITNSNDHVLYAASGTPFGTTNNFKEILASGDYYLTADITDSYGSYLIQEGATVNLDLNGHIINADSHFFYVNGNLNIKDSVGTGYLTGTDEYNAIIKLSGSANLSFTDINFKDSEQPIFYFDHYEVPAVNNEVNVNNCTFTGELMLTDSPTLSNDSVNIPKRNLTFKNCDFDTKGPRFVLNTCGDILFDGCKIKHTQTLYADTNEIQGSFIYDAGLYRNVNGKLESGHLTLKDCEVKDTAMLIATYQSLQPAYYTFEGNTTFENVGHVFSHTYAYSYSTGIESVRIKLTDNRTNKTKYKVDHRGFKPSSLVHYYIEEYDIYYIEASEDDIKYIDFELDYPGHYGEVSKINDKSYLIYKLRKVGIGTKPFEAIPYTTDSVPATLQWYKATSTTVDVTPSIIDEYTNDSRPQYGDTMFSSSSYDENEKSWTPGSWSSMGFGNYGTFFKYSTENPYELSYTVKGDSITSFISMSRTSNCYVYDEKGNEVDKYGTPDSSKTYTFVIKSSSKAEQFDFYFQNENTPKIYNVTITEFVIEKLEGETNINLSTPVEGEKYMVEATYNYDGVTYTTKSSIETYTKSASHTGGGCGIHWLLAVLFIAFASFIGVMWILLGIRKLIVKSKIQLTPVIGFSADLVLIVLFAIFGHCAACVIFVILNSLLLIAAVILYLFKEKVMKKVFKVDETAEEDTSLKESIDAAMLLPIANDIKINKETIANHLKDKYKEEVIINRRNNYIASGYLPLADTHYKFKDGKKVCFVYVYELKNGSTFFLVKTNEENAKKIKEKHDNFKKSAFPISTNIKWYSMIIDNTYKSSDEVFEIIDSIYENI